MTRSARFLTCSTALLATVFASSAHADDVVRVFIFAGQSNMVGSDSRVDDIKHFPPYVGLEQPQPNVRYSYCLGRENKRRSDGWVELQPVDGIVGPELSFARTMTRAADAPIAIIKCAAGGTHLGGDWNPDDPQGFKMYPLALDLVRSSLADLDRAGIKYRVEAFMWHQGENDMFNESYMANYGKNLKRFLSCWRRDLELPNLKFYIGELCTKTIWGMDLRPRMYAISRGQRAVTEVDPHAEYVPTAHVGVEIGGGVGLHYHYGTLGQLQHGVNYADAHLNATERGRRMPRHLAKWPFERSRRVKLFVFAGHRNMEGERAFVQDVPDSQAQLLKDNQEIPFRFSLGGGYWESNGWEPLGPAGLYDTFGPELSFARSVRKSTNKSLAIAKFTHSGSQIIDWTPAGSVAKSRNLYPRFLEFVQTTLQELRDKGHDVELAGVFYHLGENDMSFFPFRKSAIDRLQSVVSQTRRDLKAPSLKWYVSQQPPTDHKNVNRVDVTSELSELAANDDNLIHIKAFDLPPQRKQLVIDTAGIIHLGELIADRYLQSVAQDGSSE